MTQILCRGGFVWIIEDWVKILMWIIQEFEDAATMDPISNPQQNTQAIDMFSRLRGS